MLVRSESRWAVAIRRSDGSIHTESYTVQPRFERFRRTVLRGPLMLVDAISIGWRGIEIATREQTGVQSSESVPLIFVALPALIAVLGVFIALPGMLAGYANGIGADIAEAVSRPLALVLYLGALSRSAQTRRLFGYHGAEHMAIASFERHQRMPTPEEVRMESPVHVRCGSDFFALFCIAAGVLYPLVVRRPIWLGGILRVALVPVVAAMAYETMRFAARDTSAWWSRAITWPGRMLQRITTRVPADDQIEVALAALGSAVDVSGEH